MKSSFIHRSRNFSSHRTMQFILIICVVFFCAFLSCKNEDAPKQVLPYITRVDMEKMAQQQWPGYQLQRARISYFFGREYVYTSEQQNLFITIGLHISAQEASMVAEEYLSNLSGVMKDGKQDGIVTGDQYWYWPADGSSAVTNIVMIRKNALIILSRSQNSSINLEDLAAKIDTDLQHNSSYVTRAIEMSGPFSLQVALQRSIFFEGDTAKAILTPHSDTEEALEYNIDGWAHSESADNVFTKIITPAYVSQSTQFCRRYHAATINKSNSIKITRFDLCLSY